VITRGAIPARAVRTLLPALLALACVACGSEVAVSHAQPQPLCPAAAPPLKADSFNQPVALFPTRSGLRIADIRLGCGALEQPGQQVTIQYTAWLENGREFDSSRIPGRTAYTFIPGSGTTLPAFTFGFTNMRVGGVRRLVIPSGLGFGEQGAPPVIPPNATLVVDMELLKVSWPARTQA